MLRHEHARILSMIAILLTTVGVALFTLLNPYVTGFDYVSRLNEMEMAYQSFGHGLFLLIGIFWMGALDNIRRSLEPKTMDPVLRFSVLAYAASYILSMVFPCDTGCPPSGSLNQLMHSSLVWGLYCGPAVFAVRYLFEKSLARQMKVFSAVILLNFILFQIDVFILHRLAGIFQRLYETAFCCLWWQVLHKPKALLSLNVSRSHKNDLG
jgi:hypothetical protein